MLVSGASVREMGRALRAGEVTAAELAEAALARAEALQPTIGAFATLTPELTIAQARAADRELRAGRDAGPLHGIPLGVKDIVDVGGVPTRYGTARGGHRMPAADAAVVAAVRRAGAVVVGKTTTHELALGMVTPGTRNPWDPARLVGGSSGGSAAAVAAGIVPIALGSDTGGSIRCPAALCGVVGLKPTTGSIPAAGVASLAWSQDAVGPIAATAADCAELHRVLSGDGDGGGAAAPARAGALRLGVDPAAWDACAPAVAAAGRAAVDGLAAGGAEITELSLPDAALAGSASIVTILAEAAAEWARVLDGDPEGFSPWVRAAVRAGREMPAATYLRAARVRGLLRRRMRDAFAGAGVDLVATPAVPVTAAPAGSAKVELNGRRQAVDAVHSRFTALASVTGQPALSVPCGLDGTGLPVGLQLIGRPGEEALLLHVAALVEGLPGGRAVTAARAGLTTANRSGG
jgi:aspartyl-tRNA(Asn)/glutamyl-tRNA(Gln) amidotransferase subunit A